MKSKRLSQCSRVASWRRAFQAAAIAGLVLSGTPAVGDYVRNRPFEVVQPDGTSLRLFVTGDEHYRWVHDEKGRVILRDEETGLATYAIKVDGKVIPGFALVGVDDPDALGIKPNLMPDPGHFPVSPYAAEPSAPRGKSVLAAGAPSFTKINNLVIFVRFADEGEFPSTRTIRDYNDDFFNGADPKPTLRSYFLEASYGKTTIDSTFYPKAKDGLVVSYQDSNRRGHFQPKSGTNPEGYKDEEERKDREWNLIASAVTYVASEVPADLDIDLDKDGNVDSIVLVVNGKADGWNGLLWPHKWQLDKPVVFVNKKRVYKYNFEPDSGPDGLDVGTLCHELFHTLGAPDLYHYPSCRLAPPDIDPVSVWDLMNTSSPPTAKDGDPPNPPVHMGAHMKWKYGGFVESIKEITVSGTYFLSPLTSPTGMAYRIASPYSGDESFVLEYRRKTGLFEKGIPNEGLLVTRIDRRLWGNDCGSPDEVYVFRPGGTPALEGAIEKAPLSETSGRTAIGETTDPVPFLQDGSSGGLSISEVVEKEGRISFHVEIGALPCTGTINLTSPPDGAKVIGTKAKLSWAPVARAISYDVYHGTTIALTESSNETNNELSIDVEPGETYFWKVVARGAGACSRSSAVQTFRTSTEAKLTKGVSVVVPGGEKGSSDFFSIDVPFGVTDLTITTKGGPGDVGLYVRYGQRPDPYEGPWECRSRNGKNEERCFLSSPWVGTTYILVHGLKVHGDVSLVATWSGDAVAATPLEKGVRVTIADSVPKAVKYFSVTVPFGASNLSFETSRGSGIVGLRSRYQAVPVTGPTELNACSSESAGTAGLCGVRAPSQGTYYLAVEAVEPYKEVELVADWATATNPFTCAPNATTMCLGIGGRFRVQADFREHGGNAGQARVKKLTDLSGALYFSDLSSVELVAKFVSFCEGTTPNWSIYVAGLTDAAFLFKVTDTATGRYWERWNVLGNRICTIGDGAFTCPAGIVTNAGEESLLREKTNRQAAALLDGLAERPGSESRVDTPSVNSLTVTGSPSGCTPDATTMCLGPDGRFQVQADYKDYGGKLGQGKVTKLSDLSGYLTFFDPSSVELVAKFVDFCHGDTPNWSVYASGLTDLEVTFKVTDTKTGLHKEYKNALGERFCMIGDGPFPCP